MDYSAVSQAAKRFEQESKDNHKIGEIKQKMMIVLKENWMLNIETLPCKFWYKFLFIMLTLNDNSAITANENFQPIIKKTENIQKKRGFFIIL